MGTAGKVLYDIGRKVVIALAARVIGHHVKKGVKWVYSDTEF